ncbi:MAG: tRNA/rRNA methyltransferase (SpoU) [Candidatus Uhrbacteria bacterium GW2011_GWE2_45_35]|uniref:tRNA/rRNA methyltransferase (SpoU) n=2 Tax=Candidatus Uhriibacteriota TaxID=1752732 RepID=A0A0G1JK94_9BACT|nr:MAG: tRNA/rRNA methyltransferase (SpoU) [Candidatus Uhrbacteria bacterium GW2011_GWF2_44_350]KKU08729.1 MAG: tRNA/rRNA methyltransferase (SpoU) [Candidatus Uhrbacteria bacterium GW2011_GWE2_45_35]
MFILAHNIRSLHNVGSIFRSAEVFAVDKLFLTGYTGVPPQKEIAKTALGSEDRVVWEKAEDIFSLIEKLRAEGYAIVGLETGENVKSITELPSDRPVALVLGNEVTGIEHDVREKLDFLTEIPMPGHKKSLNVSVAAGIAMFVLSRKKW